MKKKTNLPPTSVEAEVKSRQHGPLKEKAQITIRVEKALLDRAYAQMKEDNTRITDIVERGMYLALTERDHATPLYLQRVRFVLANATRSQQILLLGLAVAMVEEEVLKAKGKQRTPEEEKLFEICQWYLTARSKAPHLTECLAHYSRYGRSPAEIAKLGNP